ncbi:hypothetical protein HG530_001814 [Fusarium avenaceum]|nr:hypothetical protein HG530_001814 [Fusarium avenaceum]
MIPTASDQAVCSESQTVSSLLGSCRSELEGLKETSQVVGNGTTPGGHANNSENVTNGLDVAELTRQGPPPGESIGAHCQILVVEHLEARVLDGINTLGDLAHVGDAIALLDTQSNLTVAEVVIVILIGHEPLINTENTSRLKHSEDLAVNTLKVTLDKVELVRQALLEGVVGGSLNLIVVVVETGDMGACELGDLASGTTNTTTNVEDLHALLDTNLVGKVVLMTGNGLVKGLALRESAEVEGLTPTVFVEIGGKVVVATHQQVST